MKNALTSTEPSPAEDRLWVAEDVARYLQASESWVRKRTAAGLIPCIRMGAMVRYSPDEIRAWHRGETGGRVIHLPRR